MIRYQKYLAAALLVLGTNLVLLFPLWCLYYVWGATLGASLMLILTAEVPPLIGLSILFFIWKKFEIREAPKEA